MATRIELIQREVADYFEVKKLHDLKSTARNMWLALPRMVAMYFARKLLPRASYSVIGSWFGGRDHSTVIKAVKKVERLYREDESVREAVTTIQGRLAALEPA